MRVRPSISLLAATKPYKKTPWGAAGSLNSSQSCVPKLHQPKEKYIKKALLQVFSLPDMEGQPLGSLCTLYILYRRWQGPSSQLRGTGEWKAGGTA